MLQNRSLRLIDAGGALVLLGLLSAVAWYAFLKPDTASSRMRTLTGEVAQMRADLRRLRSALEAKTALRGKLLAEAEQKGRLPARSPIDQDLRTITGLANQNSIKFLQVEPVSTVRYPNVLEIKYRVRSIGEYADHLGFLKAFEQCSFWADVTHLKLEQSMADMTNFDSARHSDMTLSFYSGLQ